MSAAPRMVQWLAGTPWRALLRPFMQGRASIFLLHRIDAPLVGVRGHNLDYVNGALDALRASGARFVPLRTIVEAHLAGAPCEPDWVAVTMDDGFADQHQLCREAFIPQHCPVTCFPITGFLDGELWPWDDQLGYAFAHSPLQQATLDLGSGPWQLDLRTEDARLASLRRVRAACKRVSGATLFALVTAIAAALQVRVPQEAPPEHRAMSWDQARELEPLGVDFGIHTMTHRIVSQLDAAVVESELRGSWHRLQAELARPLKVVSWPTGLPGDFGVRDEQIAQRLGIQAGISTAGDYARVGTPQGEPAFTLARFGFSTSLSRVLQQGSWIERGKQLVRGG